MLFYLTAIVYVYFLVAMAVTSKIRTPWYVFWLLTLPLVYFASLRGSSGKDSEQYILRYENFDGLLLFSTIDSEPLFQILLFISKHVLSGTFVTFFLLHSLLVTALFSLILSKAKEAKLYLMTIGPVFLIDGLTNGMRITIAYHIFCCSVLYRKKLTGGIFAFMSHITSVLMYGIKWLLDSLFSMSLRRVIFISSLICIMLIFISSYLDLLIELFPRISGKVNAYREIERANIYSGLSDLFILFCLILCISFSKYNSNIFSVVKFAIVGLLICAVFYISIQQSVAFIRVLKIFILGFCFSRYIQEIDQSKVEVFALLCGGLYTLNFIRQILFGDGFLPYPGLLH